MNKKQRDKNRATAEYYETVWPWPCPNCGEMVTSGHFVPPGFGGTGFYICKKQENTNAPQ